MFSKIFATVKYTLVTVNFLFLITGIIILSVGSSVQSAYNGYHPFLTDRFLSLPAFCIATGVIIFIIAFVGFFGAVKENYRLIMLYAGSMVVMFIFQLSACIAGYALRGNTIALVEMQLRETMLLYDPDTNIVITRLWDEVQTDFSCCGITNATDWIIPLNSSETGNLPLSCCSFPWGTTHSFACTLTSSQRFTDGCSDAFGSWVQSHASSIGIAGLFLVFLQAIAVGGALWMAKMSREEHGVYP